MLHACLPFSLYFIPQSAVKGGSLLSGAVGTTDDKCFWKPVLTAVQLGYYSIYSRLQKLSIVTVVAGSLPDARRQTLVSVAEAGVVTGRTALVDLESIANSPSCRSATRQSCHKSCSRPHLYKQTFVFCGSTQCPNHRRYLYLYYQQRCSYWSLQKNVTGVWYSNKENM